MSRVVVILLNVELLDPRLLFPCHIIYQVCFHPFIHYLSLSIYSGMIASARSEASPTHSEQFPLENAHELVIPIIDNLPKKPL